FGGVQAPAVPSSCWMTSKDSARASCTSFGLPSSCPPISWEVVTEGRVAVGQGPRCIQELGHGPAFALEERLAAFQLFRVRHGVLATAAGTGNAYVKV